MLILDDFGSQRLLVAALFFDAAYVVGVGEFALMVRRRGIATNGIAVLALAGFY